MTTTGKNAGIRSATAVVAASLGVSFAERLAHHPNLRVVALASDRDLVAAAASMQPDVILLPTLASNLPQLLGEVERASAKTRALVVGQGIDTAFACLLLRHHARGWIPRDAPADEAARAILAVRDGDVWLGRRMLAEVLEHVLRTSEAPAPIQDPARGAAAEPLTPREREIVACVARGLTNKEAARELHVSHETIKKHLKRVFAKLGLRHRIEVVLQHYA